MFSKSRNSTSRWLKDSFINLYAFSQEIWKNLKYQGYSVEIKGIK